MNSEMRLIIANTVKDFMEKEKSFSNYDIFCEARKNNNWKFRYLSVRNDVRDIVKNAVEELGLNYTSSFETNSDGTIYLLYHVAELPDIDTEYIDEEEDEDIDLSNVPTDFEDEESDDKDSTKNYCISSLEEFNLRLDSRGRVYITKEHIVESDLEKFSKVFVSFFHDKNEVIISDKPIVDADSVKEISMPTDRIGFYVSLKQYFGDTKSVTIISKHNKHEIIIIKNY